MTSQERITAIRMVVSHSQRAKVEDMMLDLFTASIIVQVYDALNESNKAKYASMPVCKMARLALNVVK